MSSSTFNLSHNFTQWNIEFFVSSDHPSPFSLWENLLFSCGSMLKSELHTTYDSCWVYLIRVPKFYVNNFVMCYWFIKIHLVIKCISISMNLTKCISLNELIDSLLLSRVILKNFDFLLSHVILFNRHDFLLSHVILFS